MSQINVTPPSNSGDGAAAAGISLVTLLVVLALIAVLAFLAWQFLLLPAASNVNATPAAPQVTGAPPGGANATPPLTPGGGGAGTPYP